MNKSAGQAKFIFACLILFLSGCAYAPSTREYQGMYAHLESRPQKIIPFCESERFLVILVDARHLDYTNHRSFITTVAKHPDDGSKSNDVGHAWIYIQNTCGEFFCLEGGHSGESGLLQARYFDGIMNNIDYGYANPTREQMECPRNEPNPVKYLWETQHDGFFQYGSGDHRPTYAAKVDLTEEQYCAILAFIKSYHFAEYSLCERQCSSFAVQVADLAGLKLECHVEMPIDQVLYLGKQELILWNDPCYSVFTVPSPDILEKSLMQAVREGRAEYALDWYLCQHPEPFGRKAERWRKTVVRFPKRLLQYWYISSS